MRTYSFENIEGNLYEYIYRCLKEEILSGELSAGEKLPSKRNFAKNNGVSVITVQNAYDQLISEGYVYSIPKKGYYVTEIEHTSRAVADQEKTVDLWMPEKESYLYDLSSNRTSSINFPFSIWAKLLRETISNRSEELMEPSPTNGILELREAICLHLKSFRGMTVNPNQVVIGAGTEYLYGLLIQLLGKKKTYCLENPGYKKLMKIYSQHEIDCEFANMDDKGILVSELENTKADIAHISPTHHFPTGITMPINRRYEVLSWADQKEGRYIIEDDYDSEFRLSGKPIPSLFSIDMHETVIYMNTFSKSLTPTIRISYMVLPPHLMKKFYENLSFYSCTVSNFEQYTLAAFIQRGYFEKHINRMRLYYSRQRKNMLECIANSSVKEFCQIIENDSGLHFLVKVKTTLKDKEIVEYLRESQIQMKALSDYYFTTEKKSEHIFLLNYSNIQKEDLIYTLNVIAEKL